MNEFIGLPEMASLSEGISALSAMDEKQHELYDEFSSRIEKGFHPFNLVMAGALRRSSALIQGFLLMVDQQNEFAASPFVRMQLDNVLRISAFRLVDGPTALAVHMFEGKEPAKFTPRKHELRDADLRGKLEEKHDYISEIYKARSGYVHLSQHHLIRIIQGWKEHREDNSKIRLGPYEELPPWDDEERRGCVVEFCAATMYLIQEIRELLALNLSDTDSFML